MTLPWDEGRSPLMLAPMQGITNLAMRMVQAEIAAPDVVFSEFMPVSRTSRRRIARRDMAEVTGHALNIPLVTQLVGHCPDALGEAAAILQDKGIEHINLNLGCPYGRMNGGNSGGRMLQDIEQVKVCLKVLRSMVRGSFSVKVRSGYSDPGQIMELLPVFEEHGVDFIVLHPRTVVQKYAGSADHDLTAAVVAQSQIPVIANGDIADAAHGIAVQRKTGAAGLMLGRGAIADPWLFRRIRHNQCGLVPPAERRQQLYEYISRLALEYSKTFCGEQQVLAKLKNVLEFIQDEDLCRWRGKTRRTKSMQAFNVQLELLVE